MPFTLKIPVQQDRLRQKRVRLGVAGCILLSMTAAQTQILAQEPSSTRLSLATPPNRSLGDTANEGVRDTLLNNAKGSLSAMAQNITASAPPASPVYVEGTFGNDRFDLQTLISKHFRATSRAGLLSITSAQGKYNNDTSSFDFVNVTQLNYEVFKGLSPTIGIDLNRQVGFNTTVGIQYIHAKPDLLVVVAPSVFVSGTHDVQNVVAVSYQPTIRKGWSFYGNAQVLDDYIVSKGLNARSFAHFRIDASKNQCTVGIGTDLDWYGMPSDFRTNVGPFIGYSF